MSAREPRGASAAARCHGHPQQTPRPPAPDRPGQAAAHSANTSRNGAGARPVLCYSRWVNITELVIFHRSEGSSPPRTRIHGLDLRLFVYRLERASNAAGHRHGSSTPSRTATLRACDGTASSAADLVNRRLRVSTDAKCLCSVLTWLIASRVASRFRQYSSEGPVTSASKPQSRIPRSASFPVRAGLPGHAHYQPVRRSNHRRCRRAAPPRPASLIHLSRRGRCAAR